MKIGRKISIGFAGIALLTGFLSVFAITSAIKINNFYDKIEKEKLPSFISLMNMQSFARQASVKAIEYSLRRKVKDKLKTQEALNKFELELNIFKSATDKNQKKQFLALYKKYNIFKAEINEFLLLSASSSLKKLIIEEGKVYQARKELIHLIYPIIEANRKELKSTGILTKNTINTAIATILIFGLGFVFIALVLGFRISRSISLPINKLKNIAHEIGNGKFDTKVDINSNDEIGALAHSFKVMAQNLKKAISALAKQQEFTQAIIDTAQCIILVLDKEARIVQYNPYMERLSGYSIEEVKGRDWFSTFLPLEEYDKIRTVFKKAIGDIKTCGNQNPIISKDGKLIDVLWYDKTFKNSKGNVEGLISIGVDITEYKKQNEALIKSEAQLKNINIKLEDAHKHAMYMLAVASEYKDTETGEHVKRIVQMTTELAIELGIESEQAEQMGADSVLHDLGKLGISDYILLKPGKLTGNEFETMKQHATIGAKIIGNDEWFKQAYQIALYHHEKWDGTGYPEGLEGIAIPIAARVVAVADAFDALISRRPYKEPWLIKKAVQEIRNESGTHFDPKVVDVFLNLYKKGKLKKYFRKLKTM